MMGRSSFWASAALAAMLATFAPAVRAQELDAGELGQDDASGEIDEEEDAGPAPTIYDLDGDGILNDDELGSPEDPRDTDGDGKPDYRDPDDDDDGVPTRAERPGGVDVDTDGDEIPDHLDEDDDNDGLLREPVTDLDGDGLPDRIDPDDDGDGVPSARELLDISDRDGDGIVDPYDPDDDGDGVLTRDELGPTPSMPRDGDGDGLPDYLDADDDGDGVPTRDEAPPRDSDGDGTPDYLDTDDDGDGIPTRVEATYGRDIDGDGIPNWLDLDSDGDGVTDQIEGVGDDDGDGLPNFIDSRHGRSELDGGVDGGVDAGVVSDAGVRDAGLGPSYMGASGGDDGCNVGSAQLSWSSLLWLLALALLARRRGLAALALLVLTACEEGEPSYADPFDGGGGLLDANLDANGDATMLDVDVPEASEPDAGSLPNSECLAGEELFVRPLDESDGRGFSALIVDDAIHVALATPTCGSSGSRIDYVSFNSTGPLTEDRTLLADVLGECRMRRSPALAANGARDLELYLALNLEGAYEIFRYDPKSPSSSPQQITMDPAGATDLEAGLIASPFGDGPLLAYRNETAPGAIAQLVTRRPGGDEHEIVAFGAGQAPHRLALLELPPPSELGGLLAWVNERPPSPSVRVQPLDIRGAAHGAAIELSASAGGLAHVAMARGAAGAAIVYTAQSGSIAELRFRAVDASGAVSPTEVKLTAANRSATTPSIAAHPQGFVVAFRELPLEVSAPASMRLMFVTPEGRVRAERRLADAARSGGTAQLFFLTDGRLVLLWTDVQASGSTLHALRAHCL